MGKNTSLILGIKIPAFITWLQYIAFVVLYSVWVLPEVVFIRNTAIVLGAADGKCANLTQHDSGGSDSIFGGPA